MTVDPSIAAIRCSRCGQRLISGACIACRARERAAAAAAAAPEPRPLPNDIIIDRPGAVWDLPEDLRAYVLGLPDDAVATPGAAE
jgi:hypothetical protein